MVICLTCQSPTRGRLCSTCSATLRPAAERILPGGLRLLASFEHEGSARRLMHLLKYRGLVVYAELAAELLVDRLPILPLVPVPRVLSRRIRYGIDPAREIAKAISRRNGASVVDALLPPLHAPRRAGRDHSRNASRFATRLVPNSPVVVVDDVVTTGATVVAAAHAIGPDRVHLVAAANSVTGVSSLTAS